MEACKCEKPIDVFNMVCGGCLLPIGNGSEDEAHEDDDIFNLSNEEMGD